MNILHIDSSISGSRSVSRRLSSAIVERLRAIQPGSSVVYRDLAAHPLPHFYGDQPVSPDQALLSNHHPSSPVHNDRAAALDELLASDTIVIGAPMYNFSVPTQLKSWLDAITVPGRTFSYGPSGVEGGLASKRVVVASARGGIYSPGSPASSSDHHESYLCSLFNFLGVVRLEIVRAEGVALGEKRAEDALLEALNQVDQLEVA